MARIGKWKEQERIKWARQTSQEDRIGMMEDLLSEDANVKIPASPDGFISLAKALEKARGTP